MIKILLADDHLMFLEGLAAVLKNDNSFIITGLCTSPDEIFVSMSEQIPDIILLDINFGSEKNGVKICEEIVLKYKQCKVIAITMCSERRFILGMKKAGASGYLLKNASNIQIKNAINSVLKGESFFNGEIADILSAYKNPKEVELNPKEKKILGHIFEGKTSREISEILNCSTKTIEFYRGTLFVKFNAKNVVELINNVQQSNYLI